MAIQCTAVDAFALTESRALAACFALFLLAYLPLIAAALIAAFRTPKKLIFLVAALAMVFYWLSNVLKILALVRAECILSPLWKSVVAAVVLATIADALLLAIMLLHLPRALGRIQKNSMMIIPGITFFIICGLLIAWAVLFATNFYRTSYYNGGTAMETIRSFTVFLAARRLGVATYILYQAAVIIAVGLCVYNLIRNPSASTTSGAVIVLVTLISLLMVLWPALRAMQIMMLPSEILMAPRTNIATTTAIATAGVIGTDFVLLEYFTQAAQYLALVFLLLVANRAPKQESE